MTFQNDINKFLKSIFKEDLDEVTTIVTKQCYKVEQLNDMFKKAELPSLGLNRQQLANLVGGLQKREKRIKTLVEEFKYKYNYVMDIRTWSPLMFARYLVHNGVAHRDAFIIATSTQPKDFIESNDVINGMDIELIEEVKKQMRKDYASLVILRALRETTKKHNAYKMNRRAFAVEEIVTTEQTFFGIIEILEILSKCELLTEPERKSLFDGLDTVYNISKLFLEQTKTWSSDYKNANVANFFIAFCPLLKMYMDYVAKFNLKVKAKIDLDKKKPEFKKWVQEELQKYKTSTMNATDLAILAITPVQRVMRYEMLLEQVYKATPACHPDIKNMEIAIQKIHVMSHQVDKMTNQLKKYQDLSEILGRITGLQNQFFEDGTIFIDLTKAWFVNYKKPMEVMLIMYDKMLIVCEFVDTALLLSDQTKYLKCYNQYFLIELTLCDPTESGIDLGVTNNHICLKFKRNGKDVYNIFKFEENDVFEKFVNDLKHYIEKDNKRVEDAQSTIQDDLKEKATKAKALINQIGNLDKSRPWRKRYEGIDREELNKLTKNVHTTTNTPRDVPQSVSSAHVSTDSTSQSTCSTSTLGTKSENDKKE
ncbi:Rho/RAC guanine nucleotide exchange factor, putative [Entamoeba invadens IP1]|uniref:Rho/RAC guanine nucleotide exchange factor, putative n=1 Tax=Entamoeba invadens IP1 TaxID=370355 RepID=A0A0A1TZI6_ENTIV|nr:Rho/RAC guanine nucleotide exchange factor, putative [Entamoeba invadens IP1]ELP85585.1 Rho/RAC guanine nucleotide exchange factor, putative [Entamoeba invadens IP1]|eukprot:XP_004184931.1 Rho/RAC guanine nucleotide exchange factor, putative [Entamoeba invadens IP1]